MERRGLLLGPKVEGGDEPRQDDVNTRGETFLPRMEMRKRFMEFVREYKSGETYIYREALMENLREGRYFLEVSLEHIDLWQPQAQDSRTAMGREMVRSFKARPQVYLADMERGLRQLYHELLQLTGDEDVQEWDTVQLQFYSDVIPTPMRQLNSKVLEKLVVLHGIVIQASRPEAKAQRIRVQCRNCKQMRDIVCNPGKGGAFLPRVCDGGRVQGMDKCPMDSWVIVGEGCEYWDAQSIKLQEFPEDVPVGEMPRHIELYCQRYLVDKVVPGSRLVVTGVLSTTDKLDKDNGKRVKAGYVAVLGMRTNEEGLGRGAGLRLEPREEEELRQLSREPDIHGMIARSIAPSICGSEKDCVAEIKQAVACLLFGGAHKQLPDGTRIRGDINVLLFGDPGTAKSQFLKFVERAAPVAVYTSGKGSSAAGLTAAIIRDANGNFALEGGAMVLADGGVVCIDEFDKMRPDDRVAIHEAMEQQTISIAKASITTMLSTRCSVLAAANPIFGSWDPSTDTAEQMDFATTILSRFDLIFFVKDVRDKERDEYLARHVLKVHTAGNAQQLQSKDAEPDIEVTKLRKYLLYCRQHCSPRISAAAAETLENHYISIRARMRKDRSTGAGATIPITVRQLEALARISESFAKMECSPEATIAHVDAAIRLFTSATLDAANRGSLGDSVTEDMKKAIQEVEEEIRRRVAIGARKRKATLAAELSRDFEKDAINRAMHAMILRGEMKEKQDFSVVRVR